MAKGQIVGRVLKPLQYENIDGQPVIFLAGPITGARDWQSRAIREIRNLSRSVHVASPRAAPFHGQFEQQVDWESFHLSQAGRNGCVLFWLEHESTHDCSRAFAQTTRFELGEWLARSLDGRCKVVVGFAKGFTGEHYIKRRIPMSFPHVPVCRTLKQACATAVDRATGHGLMGVLDIGYGRGME